MIVSTLFWWICIIDALIFHINLLVPEFYIKTKKNYNNSLDIANLIIDNSKNRQLQNTFVPVLNITEAGLGLTLDAIKDTIQPVTNYTLGAAKGLASNRSSVVSKWIG